MTSGPAIELIPPNISSDTGIERAGDGATGDDPIPLLGKSSGGGSSLVTTDDYPYVTVHANVDTPGPSVERFDESRFAVRQDGEPTDLERVTFLGDELDLVFVFDDTGSMSDEIEGAKEGVRFLTEEIDAQEMDARYSLVTFKNDPTVRTPFTRDAETVTSHVDDLYASGGGEIPEGNFDAIERALDLDYRPDAQRVMVDITDAPSHFDGDGSGVSDYTFDDVAGDLRESGVTFVSVAPDVEDRRSSAKSLTSAVGGFWTDISETRMGRTSNFESVLERVTDLLTSTYEIEFHTCTPPGTARELEVEFDGDRGSDAATATLSVPERFDLPPECAESDPEPVDSRETALFLDVDRNALPAGETVTVTVRSADNDFVVGATVEAAGERAETNRAGRAELELPDPGPQTITATAPDGDAAETITVDVEAPSDDTANGIETSPGGIETSPGGIETAPGGIETSPGGDEESETEGALVVEPSRWRAGVGEEVTFTVRNLDGDLLAGATVEAAGETKETNRAGNCSFTFEESGTVTVTATRDDMDGDAIDIDVEAA
jgi:Mg-chelatase subunit ChlD/plastocyanin